MANPASPANTSTSTSTRISGPWLAALRGLWVVLFLFLATSYTLGLIEYWQELRTPCVEEFCSIRNLVRTGPNGEEIEYAYSGPPYGYVEKVYPEIQTSLDQLGVSIETYALIGAFLLAVAVVFYIAAGVIIFLQRSNDWMLLYVALLIAAWPAQSMPLGFVLRVNQPAWDWTQFPLLIIGIGTLFAFPYIFPNGRFVPRWMVWIAVGLSASVVFTVSQLTAENRQNGGFLVFTTIFIGLASQVYRFRKASTPSQRQQTKWVIMGIAGFFVLGLIGTILNSNREVIKAALDDPVLFLLFDTFVVDFMGILGQATIPVSLLVSMMRFRLWDVDFIVNRTLVYGTAVLSIIGIMAGGYAALQGVWVAIFSESQQFVVAVIPAIIAALSFNPIVRWVRHFIDRRVYGIEMEYTQGEKPVLGNTAITSIGQYKGLQQIGMGGMGVVYKAEDSQNNRTVAIKAVTSNAPNREEAAARFVREAKTIAVLDHPNIVKLHEVGEDQGSPFIVMEYIDGMDLSEMIAQRGKLPLVEALNILEKIGSALEYAHQQGIVHRDLKPGNIMIDKNGRPVLMDFGIARIASMTQMTATGGLVGTLDYISPEQIQGAADVDHRADIYSLGVMTYQLLTGELPFKKNNPGALVMAHMMEPAPDPCALSPDLPGKTCHAMQRAMAKKNDERFGNVGEFVGALAG